MNVTPILVPYDHDVAVWGCATGPQVLLEAGLLEHMRALGHHVQAPVTLTLPRQARTRDPVTNLAHLGQALSLAVADALRGPDGFALVLAGNCPHAVGAAGGLARAGLRPGIVWYDAHGDLNTFATTETGFIGGMPYAVALGLDLDDWREACGLSQPVPFEAAALIGANDLDPAEIALLTSRSMMRLDAGELDRTGRRTRDLLAPRRAAADGWYLHLDLDVVGKEVPGATTPSAQPAKGAVVLASLRAARATLPVRVATIATYNPRGDLKRRGLQFIFDCVEAIVARGEGVTLTEGTDQNG
jgi:arginase